MIHKINNFLKPVENFLIKNKKIIGYIILSFLLLVIYFGQDYKLSLKGAEVAMFLLWIILWIPIFSRVFGLKIFTALSGFRKELGILMGTFSLVHFYFMFDFIGGFFSFKPLVVIFGILPQIIIFLLTITSNDFSQNLLGKNWKRLHRLVYFVPLFIILQVGFAKGFDILPLIILISYYFFKILEWKNIKFFKEEKINYPKGQKFLCVPCGYIYDPEIGNIEDGIEPGTEFVDIPDNWKCPDCGVSKADFVPYYENEKNSIPAKIISKKFLNSTTIELTIEIPKNIESKAGQFASFEYKDENGTFRRQYSVAK